MTKEDKIRQIFEEILPVRSVSLETQESLIDALTKVDSISSVDEKGIEGRQKVSYEMAIADLDEKIANETDWRKKASLSAQKISLGLE